MNHIEYISEASLEDSFIYKNFNDANNLLERMVTVIRNGREVKPENIEEQLLVIKNSMMSPISDRVIEAYHNGDILILYNDKSARVPSSIPFVIMKGKGGKTVATLFISSFTGINENDRLTIAPKVLYCLMESAYIALSIQKYPDKLKRNAILERMTMTVYTQMILRILNKDYALMMDKVLYDKVAYSVAKFYLMRVWGNSNVEIVNSYAASICVNPLQSSFAEIDLAFKGDGIKTINELLEYISTISPRLAKLNTRFFIEKYINTYNTSSVLTLDYLPYIFFVITNVLLGSFVVNHGAISDIVKNTDKISSYYSELNKIY